MADQEWQRWRLVWDRTPGDWTAETITWFMGDRQFHQISGALIGDYNTWMSLAAKPMYFILNVAVGGNWVSVCLPLSLEGQSTSRDVRVMIANEFVCAAAGVSQRQHPRRLWFDDGGWLCRPIFFLMMWL